MVDIFGWQIIKKPEDELPLPAFSPEERDDGAIVVNAGGIYGTVIDVDGAVKTDAELIQKYREISIQPEVELAIDDIINEAIVNEPEEPQVKVILDDLNVPDTIKKKIETEFENVLELLEFQNQSYEIFKRWYVDGRTYYHMIIDPKAIGEGIKELRWVDCRKIRKVREVSKRRASRTSNVVVTDTVNEYYVYNEKGFGPTKPGQFTARTAADNNGIKIAKDSIAYVTSGLTNANNDVVLSHLHKAMKPLNMLKSMEDSLVIYRISRAPERRVFYLDVGTMPRAQAEQYVKDMMTKFKNRVVYDAASGEIRDDRKFMTMLEDYWLPRRGEGKGTEIVPLKGGDNLGNITDIEYFRKLLYQSLNVPVSRMESDSTFNLGRSTEISRDEVKFHKFIGRLRLRFQTLFTLVLGKQLVLKGICTDEEWKQFSSKVAYQFAQDNFFAELKELEIMRERIDIVSMMDPLAGRYMSHEWIRKNILRQTDKEIEEQDQQISDEMQMDQYLPSFQMQNEQEMSKPVEN